MAIRLVFLWLANIFLFAVVQAKYTENLSLRPLPRNSLLTQFLFESTSDPVPEDEFYSKDVTNSQHYSKYTAFPRSLGQLIEQSNTRELHIRFSQGWWDAESWGSQPANGSHAGGIGVELWAWVEGDGLDEATKHWNKLVNTLAGFFCASLNFIDSTQTALPVKSFHTQGDHSNISSGRKDLYLLRGALPREPVCTENLTPFIKLLPCKGKAGISTLLDGHKIFDAQWQGMAVDVVPKCENGQCVHKMTQSIDVVVDVARAVQRKTSPVPKPIKYEDLRCNTSKPYYDEWRCFPLDEETEVKWTMSDIFGRNIAGSCPLAENEFHVNVEATDSWDAQMIAHNVEGQTHIQQGQRMKLIQGRDFDIQLSSSNSADITPISTPPVYVERSFTGYGQDRGGMRTVFENPSQDKEVRFVYFETLPWYMRLYLHTAKITNKNTGDVDNSLIKDLHYRPAIDRKQPSQIEIELVVPPASAITLSYDFDKTLLFLEEYPPDANRGFDIAPGVLTALGEFESNPFTIRTTSLLLSLPTPDFSMPYNVIILTCTVMALAFGSIYNLVVKQVVTDEEAEAIASERPAVKAIRRLKERILAKLDGPKRGPFPYTEDDKKRK